MAFTPLVRVAGTVIPEPAAYSATTSTIVDSGRNVKGVMVGDIVRDDVAKIDMSWKFLTIQQWSAILLLFDRKSGGQFINAVTFFNQVTAAYETRQMYISDRTAEVYTRDPRTLTIKGYVGPRIALIEV
jgi:hypothetical protein